MSVTYVVVLTGRGVDPNVITEMTGLVPTRSIREGSPSTVGALVKARATSWIVELVDESADEIEPLLKGLLDSLESASVALREVSRDFRTYIGIWMRPNNGYPAVQLSPEVLSRIATLGAGLDIDIEEG